MNDSGGDQATAEYDNPDNAARNDSITGRATTPNPPGSNSADNSAHNSNSNGTVMIVNVAATTETRKVDGNSTKNPPCSSYTTMVIPLSAVVQREQEMNQTAKILGIPLERWSGSLLYNEWMKQQPVNHHENGRKTESVDPATATTVKLTLHPDTDSLTLACHWQCGPAVLDLIQTYYVTGTLRVSRTARGCDVLAAVDYFAILYQPDQCHFANYDVYRRVQQWSRYLCHRASLAAWVVHRVQWQQQQQHQQQHSFRKILTFGTTDAVNSSSGHGNMELGTKPLSALGDTDATITTGAGSKQKGMATIAFKLFNSPDSNYSATQKQTDAAEAADGDDENTLPGPEKSTAKEMRDDFATYLQRILSPDHQECTVKFPIKPVTIHNTDANSTGCGGTTGTSPQKLAMVNRAVLIVDLHDKHSSPIAPKQENQVLPQLKHARSKSEISAPIDEFVEEELAKGRREELLQQVDARKISIDVVRESKQETIKTSPTSVVAHETSLSTNVNLFDQMKTTGTTSTASEHSKMKPRQLLDPAVDAPHDELNASYETNRASHNESPTKKKKKPKPVFELPDKLLSVDSLSRANPVAKASAAGKQNDKKPGDTGYLNDLMFLPAPITIVRSGTYDNTVTSALTGPFYMDDNGNLRDVFEHCGSDTDYDAQARRHEWIQTALMNRGIDERMQTLLEAGEETDDSYREHDGISFDPWDWLTGLGVCEFSRTVMHTVEQYASGLNLEPQLNPEGQKQPDEERKEKKSVVIPSDDTPIVATNARSPAIVKSILSDESDATSEFHVAMKPAASPSGQLKPTVTDQFYRGLCGVHSISRELHTRDNFASGAAAGNVMPNQQNNTDGSSLAGSQSSKESPRDVKDQFHRGFCGVHSIAQELHTWEYFVSGAGAGNVMPNQQNNRDGFSRAGSQSAKASPLDVLPRFDAGELRLSTVPAINETEINQPLPEQLAHPSPTEVTPKKKTRGIKALFRRRKVQT